MKTEHATIRRSGPYWILEWTSKKGGCCEKRINYETEALDEAATMDFKIIFVLEINGSIKYILQRYVSEESVYRTPQQQS